MPPPGGHAPAGQSLWFRGWEGSIGFGGDRPRRSRNAGTDFPSWRCRKEPAFAALDDDARWICVDEIPRHANVAPELNDPGWILGSKLGLESCQSHVSCRLAGTLDPSDASDHTDAVAFDPFAYAAEFECPRGVGRRL